MNYLDIFVMYLACGCPFGVYFYINHRKQTNAIWLKSFGVLLFWIPYAIQLLHSNVTNKLPDQPKDDLDQILKASQRQFEDFLPSKNSSISLFALRGVIERYSALTLANDGLDGVPAQHEKEIYQLAKSTNAEISAICLNRRNKMKLRLHQTQARQDFLNTLKILLDNNFDQKQLVKHSLEFVKILNDKQAIASIKEIFNNSMQTEPQTHVKELETERWKIEQQQLNEKQVSPPLRAMRATISRQKTD